MSLQFHEKDVAADFARHRERLDPGQIELLPLGDREGIGQTAGLVLDLEHQRRLVAARAAGVGMPDHGKAGGIARDVLDVFGEHVEPVVNTSLAAGDGGCILPAGGHLGGHAGAGHLDEPRGGEVTGQPVAALGERLRATVDLLDRRTVARCEQRVMDPQRHLSADLD